ncbi:MAG TPA: hypothetical protein ENF81_05840 [Thermotogaceae bacterium]|nr:hypothetical protein [Thermotogaceae bacterium]
MIISKLEQKILETINEYFNPSYIDFNDEKHTITFPIDETKGIKLEMGFLEGNLYEAHLIFQWESFNDIDDWAYHNSKKLQNFLNKISKILKEARG